VKDKKFDVLVVGELNIDLILDQMETFPQLGKEVLAQKMLYTIGSSSAIFASNLSAIGSRVGFCGRVGRDTFGDKILSDLARKGVNTDHIIRSHSADTGITVVFNVGEERAMVTYPGAMNELSAADVTDQMLADAAHLHVSSIFMQPALKPGLATLLRRAQEMGLTTSLDPQWDPAEVWDCDLPNILPLISVFLPNLEELKNLTNHSSLENSLSSIREWVNIMAVKNGNAGAVLWTGRELLHQPAFLNPDVADAIGAGDSFNAGFIHRFVQDRSARECLEFGALCGAINTTRSGGTTAFESYEVIKSIALQKFNYQL
jgi:sugar/nucleoside kinase (ribokinase family)